MDAAFTDTRGARPFAAHHYQRVMRGESVEPSTMGPCQAFGKGNTHNDDHGVSNVTRKLVAKNEDEDETKVSTRCIAQSKGGS